MVMKANLRATLIQMKLGEALLVSADDYADNTIRNYASRLGSRMDRTYSVHCDRAAKTTEVIRLR